MGRHDQIAGTLFAPQQSRGEMDRVEGAKLGRQRLRGPRQHRRGYLDDLDAIEDSEYRLAAARQLVIR